MSGDSLRYPSPKHIPVSILGPSDAEKWNGLSLGLQFYQDKVNKRKSRRAVTSCYLPFPDHPTLLQNSAHIPDSDTPRDCTIHRSNSFIHASLVDGTFQFPSPTRSGRDLSSVSVPRPRARHKRNTTTGIPLREAKQTSANLDCAPFKLSLFSLMDELDLSDDNLSFAQTFLNSLTLLPNGDKIAHDDLTMETCSLRSNKVSRKSLIGRLFRGLKRSFSFHHTGHLDIPSWSRGRPDSHHSISPPPSESGTWRTMRSKTRFARLFQCIRDGEKDSPFVLLKDYSGCGSAHRNPALGKHLGQLPIQPISNGIQPPLSFRRVNTVSACVNSDSGTVANGTLPNALRPQSVSENSLLTDHSVQARRPAQRVATQAPRIRDRVGCSFAVPGLVQYGPLHSSLVGGRSFCFYCSAPPLATQIETDASNGVARIFAAPSSLGRLRWLTSFRRTAKPNLANERRRENSLKLSILEARNIPNKRRNLPNVSVMTISLYKEADVMSKDARRFGTSRLTSSKHRRLQNQLIGFVTIPTSEISGRTDSQVWVALQPPAETISREAILIPIMASLTDGSTISSLQDANNSSSLFLSSSSQLTAAQRQLPQIRIRARYQSVEVLPIKHYWAFRKLLLEQSLDLTQWLEGALTAKSKEEAASSLVGLQEYNNTLVEFLTNLVVREVATLENESMAFRSNTMATKAVECYVKLAGSTYLHNLLHRLIQRVLASPTAWEVNPEKLNPSALVPGSLTMADTEAFGTTMELPPPINKPPSNSLMANQLMLLHQLNLVWRAVQSSLPAFPSALIRVFSSFRSALEPNRGAEFCDNLISSCIFLRLICPALLSPSLFGLVSAFPSAPSCQRNLTLLAKSLQSLANFSAFDDKEPFMRFLNGFVSSQLSAMRTFIRNISSGLSGSPAGRPDDSDTMQGMGDLVDEGYELANLHLLLSDLMLPSKQTGGGYGGEMKSSFSPAPLPDALSDLPLILDELSKLLCTTMTTSSHSLTNIADHRFRQQKLHDERLHATLPAPTSKTITKSSSSVNQQHNTQPSNGHVEPNATDYAYHSSSTTRRSPVPYYTLHQNPGICAPNGKASSVTATVPVNILSAPVPQSAMMAQPPAPHDYDDPYDPSSVLDVDHQHSRLVLQSVSPVPSHVGSITSVQSNLSRSSGLVTTSHLGHPPPVISYEDEEHVYDAVPLSDTSSTDDLVQANQTYATDRKTASPPAVKAQLTSTNGVSSRTASEPHLAMTDTLPDLAAARTSTSYTSSRLGSNLLNSARLDQPDDRPSCLLTARLAPRQVTTASVQLSKPIAGQSIVRLKPILSPIPPTSRDISQSSHPVIPNEFVRPPEPDVRDNRVGRFLPLHSRNGQPQSKTFTHSISPTLADVNQHDLWTSRTGSSISLGASTTTDSVDRLLDTESGLTPVLSGSQTQDELMDELSHLRFQLQRSRADAARAADRLSQQEMELTHLRRAVGQICAPPAVNIKSSNAPEVRTNGQGKSRSPAMDSLRPRTVGQTVGNGNHTPTATTFDDLDDAMARLEHEQVELQQEQRRIRARLAASRQAQPTTRSPISAQPTLHLPTSNQPSTTRPSIYPSTNGQSASSRSRDVNPKFVSYGPRIRHNPPPAPRNTSCGDRYAR